MQVPNPIKCDKTPNAQTGDCYSAPLAIGIYDPTEYEKIKDLGSTGQFMGKNSEYVFISSSWHESPFLEWDKVDFEQSKIAASFKLIP